MIQQKRKFTFNDLSSLRASEQLDFHFSMREAHVLITVAIPPGVYG